MNGVWSNHDDTERTMTRTLVQQIHQVSYDDWNSAIINHFFNSSQAGRPVYLQVDTDALQLIGQQLGLTAAESEPAFISAVRQYVVPPSENPFRQVILAAKYLRSNDPTPRFIAFLGFCVLAATKMERDDTLNVSAANYYRRLNELLRLTRQGRPPNFEDTIIAWNKLHEWLNVYQRGELGIATARPLHAIHPYVGYPQSQCLLRAADRHQLPRFFQWSRLQPEDTPDVTWVITMLQRWVEQSSCSFSSQTRRRISQASTDVVAQIAYIALEELQSWDGTIESTGSIGARETQKLLHLKFDSRGRRILWRAYQITSGESISDRYLPIPSYTIPSSDDLEPSVPILVFGSHPDLMEWTQQPRIVRAYPSVLLVRDSHYNAVFSYLKMRAESGWTEVNWDGIPIGWRCIRHVILSRPDPDAPWPELQIQDDTVLRFRGGLKLERGVYLHGFAPILELYTPTESPAIVIDGQDLPSVVAGTTTISLNEYCPLAGYHTLTVGTKTRSFITRDPHRAFLPISTTPHVGYRLHQTQGQYKPLTSAPVVLNPHHDIAPGEIVVSGARLYGHSTDMPDPLPYIIWVPKGFKRYIVLGYRPGDVYEERYLASTVQRGLMKLEIPFEPQWLIKVRKKRYLSALQPAIRPPSRLSTTSAENIVVWCQWIQRHHHNRFHSVEITTMWSHYQNITAHLMGRDDE